MNSKGKSESFVHSDFENKKDDINLHYQFFPEDRVTTVFVEDPLPCPKKNKKKGLIKRKKRMARRLLRSERTILRKEWKKWQRQLSKQSNKKLSGSQAASKNSRFTNKTTNMSNKAILTNSQPNSSKSNALMPTLKRPLWEMTVPELVKYKNDLNNYLKYVCEKKCSSNSSIPKTNGKSEKNNKIKFSKSIKSLISSKSGDKEELTEKFSDSIINNESDELSSDNGMGEKMEIASELIAEGIHLLNKKGTKKSSNGPNIKELSLLIRKLRNFQRTFDKAIFTRPSNSKSFHNKVVSIHAPPNKLQRPPSKKIEPQIRACEFPINKISKNDTEEDGMPWVKETIKNSKNILRKYSMYPSDFSEMMNNTNLTCDSKIWLKIEKLLDDKNNAVDMFVNKVMKKLRKNEDEI